MKIMLHGAAGATQVELTAQELSEFCKTGNPVTAMNRKFANLTAGSPAGTASEQVFKQLGLVSSAVAAEYGIRPATVSEVFSGKAQVQDFLGLSAGPITQDYSAPFGAESRVITAMAVAQEVYSRAQRDYTSTADGFEAWIGSENPISGNHFLQPILDIEGADGVPSRVTEGTKPPVIARFSTSDRMHTIPARAIGVEWTKESLTNVTIDIIGISLQHVLTKLREADTKAYLNGLFLGGDGINVGAVPVTESSTLDSASTGGELTYTAFLRFLNANAKRRKLTHMACNLTTFIAWEKRTGRPGTNQFDPTLFRLDPQGAVQNQQALGLGNVQFLVDDDLGIPDGQFWAVDSRVGITRATDTTALFSGVDEVMMEKKTQMRMDWAECVYRTLGNTHLDPFAILQITA